MKRLLTFTVAAAVAAGFSNSAWSQGGQGGGTSGTAGASGTSGTAGTSGAGGTAGVTGTPGSAAGAQGTAAGQTQIGAGQAQVGVGARGQGQFSASPGNFDPINPTPFFNDAGARQQLNMNNNQFNQLSRAYQNAYTRYSQGVTGLNRNLTEQQRMQQMQQLRARFNQDFDTSLNTTFSDPQVRSRFNQLNWQFMGPSAFNDPRVRQQLNLTPDQRQQLGRLARAWHQQLAGARPLDPNNPSSMNDQQWIAFRTQYRNQLGTILTPAQQQVYQQLVGQPYDFPVNVYLPPAPTTTVQPGLNPQSQQLQQSQRPAPTTQPSGTVR
jgi:hypothetical protein